MSIDSSYRTHERGYDMEKVRINMYLPLDLKQWFMEEAEKNGFNLTTMIQVAMLDYKKQQEAMGTMNIINSMASIQPQKQSVDMKDVLVEVFRKDGYKLEWNGNEPIISDLDDANE